MIGATGTLKVTPADLVISDGDTGQLTAEVLDENGKVVTDLPSTLQIQWSTANPRIASVSAEGVVRGIRPGTARIKAEFGQQNGWANVVVQPVATTLFSLYSQTLEGFAGSTLPDSIQVRVLDRHGEPVPGATVRFEVTAGGGTVSPSEVTTNASGGAKASWTLGPTAGLNSIVVSSASLDPLALHADGMADLFNARLEVVAGDDQQGQVGQALADPVVVRLVDDNGNPIPGGTIEWLFPYGGGITGGGISSPGYARIPTDNSGNAQLFWNLGPLAGLQVARARGTGGSRWKEIRADAQPGAVREIVVSPGATTLVPNAAVQLTATPYDRYGNVVENLIPQWSSANTNVATVNATGLVLGVGPGTTEVQATIAGTQGQSLVTVAAGIPARLEGTSGSGQSGTVGQPLSNPLSVRVADAGGSPLSGIVVAWTVTAGGGSVSRTTTFTDAAGTTEVSWTLGTVAGANALSAAVSGLPPVDFAATAAPGPIASVSVDPSNASVRVGSTRQLSGQARDSYGNAIPGVSLSWSSSANGVASVSQSGLVTGIGHGSATITASATSTNGGSGNGTSSVSVTASSTPTLEEVVISPPTVVLGPGAQQTFAASGIMSDGTSTSVTVHFSATGGSINSNGVYTAGSTTGSYRVVATENSSGIADTADVTIQSSSPPPPSVSSVEVKPAGATVPVGGRQQYTATAIYSDGSTVDINANWSTNGGTITSDGMFTAGWDPDRYKVYGSDPVSGRADTVTVFVEAGSAPTLIGVRLTPQNAQVNPGGTVQYTAQGVMSDGSTSSISAAFSATGGSISSAGLYTAGSTAGTYRVIATHGGSGLADTVSVTIGSSSSPTLTQVVIQPKNVTLAPGGTQQFGASGIMSDGTTTGVSVTFSATGGQVTAAGLYTAGSATGSFRVVATEQGSGLADTANVTIATVSSSALSEVVIYPSGVTLAPGETFQFFAQGIRTDATPMAITVRYSATGGSIGTGGLYTAGSTTGTFRAIAQETTTGLADTAIISIAPPTPPGAFPQEYSLSRPLLSNNPNGLLHGDDWQKWQRTQDVCKSFFHQNADPCATGAVQLVTNAPMFGKVPQLYQGDNGSCGAALTPYPPTVRYSKNWSPGRDKVWIRATARFMPGFTLNGDPCGGNPAWKFMFTGHQREFELYNSDAYFNVRNTFGGTESRLPGSPSAGVTMYKVDGEYTDGEWYEFISYDERLSSGHYRNRRWIRRITSGGGTTLNYGPWRRHGWESTGASVPLGLGNRVELGINKNRPTNPGEIQWFWWGPWEAIDGSVMPDPYGLANDMLR